MSQPSASPLRGHRIPDNYFFPYPAAKRIQQLLLSRVMHPNLYRPIGALILGEPGNGKSFLLRDLKKQVMARQAGEGFPEFLPAISFDAPPGATRNLVFYALAEAVGMPLPARGIADRFIPQLRKTLHQRQVRVILVDELNNLLSGSEASQRKILDDLKSFTNTLGFPCILAGTPKSITVFQDDRQYLSRWPPILLPIWQRSPDFWTLILNLESEMEVEPGVFANEEASDLILRHSEGAIGRIVQILNDSFQEAHDSGDAVITVEHIRRACFTDIPWVPPPPGGGS